MARAAQIHIFLENVKVSVITDGLLEKFPSLATGWELSASPLQVNYSQTSGKLSVVSRLGYDMPQGAEEVLKELLEPYKKSPPKMVFVGYKPTASQARTANAVRKGERWVQPKKRRGTSPRKSW